MRMLIFGLERGMPQPDLQRLLKPIDGADLDLIDLPGDNDEAYAVVQIDADPGLAGRLAARINTSRYHGRRLQSWVLAMAWS